MSTPSFSPRFVKAKITFKIGNNTFPIGEHLVNTSGVPGFKWTQFDPRETVGRRIQVAIQTMTSRPFEIHCDAMLTCEETETAPCLGLFFILSSEDSEKLASAVAAEGILPEFVRKFPRISFQESMNIMPSRALLHYFIDSEEACIVCDIDNISPSGFQIYTEDKRVHGLTPGEVVRVQLQPRGNYPFSIEAISAVKRVTRSIQLKSGNVRTSFGLSIMTITDEHRVNFTDLLRNIVTGMKKG